jgi:hypothetical protein
MTRRATSGISYTSKREGKPVLWLQANIHGEMGMFFQRPKSDDPRMGS